MKTKTVTMRTFFSPFREYPYEQALKMFYHYWSGCPFRDRTERTNKLFVKGYAFTDKELIDYGNKLRKSKNQI